MLGGTLYTLDLTADETDGDTVNTWLVNWGDGSPTEALVDGETSDTHVYANPTSAAGADYTVTATAVDNGGSWPAASVPVTVNQAVTQVSASGAASVAAGATYTLTLGQTAGDALSGWTIDWGDGSTDTPAGDASSFTHVFADSDSPGPTIYSIIATASNDEGDFVAIPVNVTVTPAPPTVSISGAGSVTQGAIYTLDLSDVEPGANTVTGWTVNWGDGDTDTLTADAPSITHVYADPSTGSGYQITASATDTGGSASYAATPINVTVSAASGPTTLGIAAAGGATTVAEGATYTLDLSQTAGDALSDWNINWGDGTSSTVAGNATSIQHVYADAGSTGPWDYSITATGDNDQGTFAAAAPVAVTVTAVAPTLGISGASTIAEGETYTLDLSAIEPAGGRAVELDDQLGRWLGQRCFGECRQRRACLRYEPGRRSDDLRHHCHGHRRQRNHQRRLAVRDGQPRLDADLHAQRRGHRQRRRHLHADAHADRGCPARRLDRQLGRRLGPRAVARGGYDGNVCLWPRRRNNGSEYLHDRRDGHHGSRRNRQWNESRAASHDQPDRADRDLQRRRFGNRGDRLYAQPGRRSGVQRSGNRLADQLGRWQRGRRFAGRQHHGHAYLPRCTDRLRHHGLRGERRRHIPGRRYRRGWWRAAPSRPSTGRPPPRMSRRSPSTKTPPTSRFST